MSAAWWTCTRRIVYIRVYKDVCMRTLFNIRCGFIQHLHRSQQSVIRQLVATKLPLSRQSSIPLLSTGSFTNGLTSQAQTAPFRFRGYFRTTATTSTRMSSIVGHEIASKAVKSGYFIKPRDIQPSSDALHLCLDERSMVDMHTSNSLYTGIQRRVHAHVV